MAKKAKSIETLSFPKWRKRRYAMLNFICPKTASGSIHRRPLCLSPSSDVSSSRAFFLYLLRRWLTSIMRRSPLALQHRHRKGQPLQFRARYRAFSLRYPLAVFEREVPMRCSITPSLNMAGSLTVALTAMTVASKLRMISFVFRYYQVKLFSSYRKTKVLILLSIAHKETCKKEEMRQTETNAQQKWVMMQHIL